MSKVFTYVSVMVGVFAMLTIFNLAGSTTSQLLEALSWDNPQDLKSFDFFSLLYSPAGLVAVIGALGGIVASLFRGQSWFWMIIAGFVGVLAGWMVGDMYSVMWQSSEALAVFPWMGEAIKVVFVVWIAGFLIALISFWGGSD